MRSSSYTQAFLASCAHRKDQNNCDIHPVTARMNAVTVVVFGAMYTSIDSATPGQHVYFLVQIALYMASYCFHGCRSHWFTRFLDQSLIGLYIIVCPLPFLPNENWVWAYVITASGFFMANKWYRWEKNKEMASVIFFTFGVVSTSLLYIVGMPHIGTTRLSYEGLQVAVVLAMFVLMLWIFVKDKGEFIPGYWGNPETCHTILFIPMMLMSTLVASLNTTLAMV